MTNHADFVMLLIKRRLRLELVCFQQLVLILVEQEIFFSRIVGPDVFDALIHLTFILNLLQILQYFEWSSRTDGIIYEFILGSGPRCVF